MRKHNNFANKLNVEVEKQMICRVMKDGFIEDFNKAVKKGASEAYLRSLLRQTKQDIAECNSALGLLPQDGLSQLDMSWEEGVGESHKLAVAEHLLNPSYIKAVEQLEEKYPLKITKVKSREQKEEK